MKRLMILFSVVCLLTGCKMYKTYSRPDIKVDEQYRDVECADTIAPLASFSWRELFVDKRLQILIEQGLAHNADLRIARLRVEEAETALTNARLSYLPSVSLTSEGAVNRYGGNSVTHTYNLGISASWELDIFGKVTNAQRGARAALESTRAYQQAVQAELVATIANSYFALLLLDSQLSINERTLDCWKKTISTLEALKKSGKSNDTAVLQAKANRMLLETSVLSIRKNICGMENALSVLLGMSPQRIERNSLSEMSFPEKFSTGVPLKLLSNRPDVRQAEYNLAQAFYATNAARAAFYPSIVLSGVMGWTNNGGGVVINPGKCLLNAIGGLTQPLFNKGTNRATLQIAKLRQEEATIFFQQKLLDAGKEVNDALIQWQIARQRMEVEHGRIAMLREAVSKTELIMSHSSTTYLEVLTAQQTLLDAELSEVQDMFDKIQGMVNLYHALGGGL